MIKAYISICLADGKRVNYVRDIVLDSNGVDKLYYAYKGAAHQELGLTQAELDVETGLSSNTTYNLKVNANAGGATAISIKTSDNTKWRDVLPLLNSATKNTLNVEWGVTPQGDIRATIIGKVAGTTIALASGDTSDLFASLSNFSALETAVAGDQFLDQTGAGKIKGDYDTLLSTIETANNTGTTTFIQFPEVTPTDYLIRSNTNDSSGTEIITQVAANNITAVQVIEKYFPEV